MHDLIKQMGRELLHEQPPHDPRRRILWNPDEIYEVLSNKREARAVEAILLDMDKVDKLIIWENTFEKVPNLKFLRISSSSFDGESKQLPHGITINIPELRYLRWDNCPFRVLQVRADNLVKLVLREGKIEKFWEDLPCLEKLKEIDVSDLKNLKELPDLSKAPNLEVIKVTGCPSLIEIPSSISSLNKLDTLNLRHCYAIEDFIPLKHLVLPSCPMLQSIPESIGHFSDLMALELHDCERLKHLPDTIGDMISLKSLELDNCPMLQSIPETIGKLKSLETFKVLNGRDITKFPNLPKTVRRVYLRETMIEEIPSCIGDLHQLEELDMSGSKRLKTLPGSIYELKYLNKLILRDCPCLESFTSQICGTRSYFGEHDAEETSSRTLLLPNLRVLIMSRPEKSDCVSFHCPPFSNLPSLRILHLINFNMPEISRDLGLLTDLEVLDLSGNDFGLIPASIRQLTKLSELRIDGCVNLYSFSVSELPPNIEVLSADGCAALAEVSEISNFNFTNKSLGFANCFNLKEEMQFFSKLLVSMVGDKALVVLPGNEVPSCFDHRNKGSSLTVSLPFGSSSVERMGFVACIVAADHLKDDDCVEWKCQYTRKNCSTSALCGQLSLFHEARVPSGHMLFLNGALRLKEEKEVVFDHISFEFSLTPSPWGRNEPLPKIKECGVCLQFTHSSSSSSATCDANGTSGPWEPLEAENNVSHRQGEVKEPSTKKLKLF